MTPTVSRPPGTEVVAPPPAERAAPIRRAQRRSKVEIAHGDGRPVPPVTSDGHAGPGTHGGSGAAPGSLLDVVG
jgi:hypothetical protein